MDIKKIIFTGLIVLLISSCTGVDSGEENEHGFEFTILNYSEKEYDGFVLYLGNIQNGIFVEKDSLVGENVKIFKKDEGPNTSNLGGQHSGVSNYKDFKDLKGLNEYGKWDANFNGLDELYFKVKLSDGTIAVTDKPVVTINRASVIILYIREAGIELTSR